MGEVVELSVITRLPVPPEKIIKRASEANLTSVVVIGYDADGDFWFASSDADGGGVLWLLELAKKELFECVKDSEAPNAS
jgi:hypothetical protein